MLVAVFALGSVCFITLLAEVVQKVRTGHGLETYLTGEGYEFSYLGALLLIGTIPVVLLIGAVVGWWLNQDERDFNRRYPPAPK